MDIINLQNFLANQTPATVFAEKNSAAVRQPQQKANSFASKLNNAVERSANGSSVNEAVQPPADVGKPMIFNDENSVIRETQFKQAEDRQTDVPNATNAIDDGQPLVDVKPEIPNDFLGAASLMFQMPPAANIISENTAVQFSTLQGNFFLNLPERPVPSLAAEDSRGLPPSAKTLETIFPNANGSDKGRIISQATANELLTAAKQDMGVLGAKGEVLKTTEAEPADVIRQSNDITRQSQTRLQPANPEAELARPAVEIAKLTVIDVAKPVAGFTKPGNEIANSAEETAKPVAETAKPAAEITKPVAEAAKPTTEIIKPVAETAKPAAEITKPVAEAAKPTAEITKPVAETAKPAAEITKPVAETAKLAAEITKPVTEAAKPAAEITKPVAEAAKPTAEITKPVAEASKPAVEITKPVAEAAKPAAEITKPVAETAKPAAEITKPVAETAKPAAEITKPVAEAAKPAAEITKPVAEASKPAVEITKPVAEAAKPAVETAKPADEIIRTKEQSATGETTSLTLKEPAEQNLGNRQNTAGQQSFAQMMESKTGQIKNPDQQPNNNHNFTISFDAASQSPVDKPGATQPQQTPPNFLAPRDEFQIKTQIVEHATLLNRSAQESEMIIRLKPEHLGEMALKVTVTNGVVNASFHSNNAEVRSILENSLQQLKTDLANAGFKVDNVSISAGLSQFNADQERAMQWQQQQNRRGSGKKGEADYAEAIEGVAANQQVINTSKDDGVDYRI